MAAAAPPKGVFGDSVKRKEDPRLISGKGQYVDDVRLPDTLYVTFVRSPHAHARITGADVARAETAAGVVAVYTGRDVADIPSVPCGWLLPDSDLKIPAHPAIAIDTVRFTGDIVAAVVSRSRAAGRDAANLVQVTYEPLPAVTDAEQATKPGAPQLHPDVPNNTGFHWNAGTGDVDAAFGAAPVKVSLRIRNQRLIPNAMEPRGIVASYNQASGALTYWTSTQIPHTIKLLLAMVMGVPEQKIQVIAPDVGGGFGSKLYLYPEDLAMVHLAKIHGQPLKWIEEKRESYVATTHGRDQIQDVELCATAEGRITGLRVKVFANLGAYQSLFAPGIPTILFGTMLTGAYKIPAIHGEVLGVFTNTTPVDAYRGAGRPEAAHLMERIVDRLAQQIGKDPVDVRRLNFIPAGDFPYTTPTGPSYDSGDYAKALDKALDISGYRALREEQRQARAQGRLMGIGLSSYVEICGMGPSKVVQATGAQAALWESATVRVHATGKVTAYVGTSPHGQGHETAFAQMVATELGVGFDDVDVVHGDSGSVQMGVGTFGSRSMAVGGGALHMSLTKIKHKALEIAAHLLEASVDDMVYEEGNIHVKGDPGRVKTIGDVALTAFMGGGLPEGMEPGLDATSYFDPQNFTWPFGTHIAVTDVDRDTGQVRLRSYYAVDDCGPLINPMLAEGQVHGGVAQGIGQALCEQAVYDDSGQLVSGSLMDYAIPTAEMLPDFQLDHTVTPSSSNPWGVKGIGEAGTIAASAAVVNSVVDALAPLGVTHLDMPLTSERIWNVIQSAPLVGR
ncbi:MAG: xanthine dehydrogenase family protein molybdopterin-binding subunit [Chloroflexota bacterium]